MFSGPVTCSNSNLVNIDLAEMTNPAHAGTQNYYFQNKHRETLRVLCSLANMDDTQKRRVGYTSWKSRGKVSNKLNYQQQLVLGHRMISAFISLLSTGIDLPNFFAFYIMSTFSKTHMLLSLQV